MSASRSHKGGMQTERVARPFRVPETDEREKVKTTKMRKWYAVHVVRIAILLTRTQLATAPDRQLDATMSSASERRNSDGTTRKIPPGKNF